ncbi:uncharacterized protein LOC108670937, partial [Hyalella azteca]|uniref:Uncharacterized protein LOC108670937 n=1 Tax=Hyalella azteca TaxID=294128 RepID=A0A8B7NJU2_HYAAZ
MYALFSVTLVILTTTVASSVVPAMSITSEDGSFLGPSIEITRGQRLSLVCSVEGYGISKKLSWSYEMKGRELRDEPPLVRGDFLQQRQLRLPRLDAGDCGRELVCSYGDDGMMATSMSVTLK